MRDKEKMHCPSENPVKGMEMNVNPNMENPNINPYQMDDMDERRLEALYPRTYFIVIPAIRKRCDAMEMKREIMYIPDREELQDMIDEIYEEVEDDIERELDEYDDDDMTRQRGRRRRRRRRLTKDLIGIALIGELLRRRRRHPRPPFYGYPRCGYYEWSYPGYYPPYPGY